MKTLMFGVIIIIVVFSSYIDSLSQIRGDEKEVKDLVIQLVQEEVRDQLVPELIMSDFGVSHSVWGYPKYKDLRNKLGSSDADYIVHKIDSLMNKIEIKLEDIRVIAKDKDINRVTCAAKLNFNDKDSYDVKYTAQMTIDNNKYYVEILDN
jgi:hypothetical protein